MDNKNKTGAAAQGAVKPRVLEVRGKRVVLDRELAAFVGMSTKVFNQSVKRNAHLFDGEMMFQLTVEEVSRSQTATLNDGLRSQSVTTNTGGRGGTRYLPYAFTEEGVKMLEKVLKRSIGVEFQDEEFLPAVVEQTWSEGTIVLYHPDDSIELNVRFEGKTVWLTQEQMAQLFGTTKQNISLHIANVFEEKEQEEGATVKDFLTVQIEGNRQITRSIAYYNLDVIISVGFRVKSVYGSRFRRWASQVLDYFLLQERGQSTGYGFNPYYDRKLFDYDRHFETIDDKLEILFERNKPPKVGLLSGNSVYDAHVFVSGLVERAKKHITVIDPYIDSSVLVLLSKRKPEVNVDIYYDDTKLQNRPAFNQDLALHNKQYPTVTLTHVDLLHDRFFIVDEETYHIGASIKDLGKKMFAFDTIPFTEQEVLKKIGVL